MDQGVRLGGRYEVGRHLGRGGMAEVTHGTDIRLGREVAIKRLRSDLATDSSFQARFRREAQAAAGLNHPNIVAVYDTGEEMAPDGSHVQPYIVMEFVQGRTLREVLNNGRKLLPERALEIMDGVLNALDYSHRAGIVHRDIKPGNVMLTPGGQVKVMDFGIARAVTEASTSVTQTSAVVGTAQYLSPEQARGETVDARSDIYSAGCLLYELLAGRPPFVGDSPFSVAYQHVREHADPPSTHNPDIPPELDAIVMKALAKRVEDRYQGAEEMRADIARYLDGQPIDAPTALVAAAPVVTAAESETGFFQAADDTDEDKRRRAWPIIGLVILLLALLGGAVFAGLQLFGGDEVEQVEVPSVTNMTQANATRRLRQEGLAIGEVERVTDEEVPRGRVISQDPDEGDLIDPGTEVDLVVSAGKEDVVVKYVIGMPRRDATRVLQDLGLEVDYETRESTEPKNTVIATNPNAGETVPAGSTVTLALSEGQKTIPTVVGRTESEARQILRDAGFQVSVEYDDATRSQKGIVLRQDPSGSSSAPEGATVTITVSDYEEPSPDPTPTTPTTEPTPTTPTDSPTSPGALAPPSGSSAPTPQ